MVRRHWSIWRRPADEASPARSVVDEAGAARCADHSPALAQVLVLFRFRSLDPREFLREHRRGNPLALRPVRNASESNYGLAHGLGGVSVPPLVFVGGFENGFAQEDRGVHVVSSRGQ